MGKNDLKVVSLLGPVFEAVQNADLAFGRVANRIRETMSVAVREYPKAIGGAAILAIVAASGFSTNANAGDSSVYWKAAGSAAAASAIGSMTRGATVGDALIGSLAPAAIGAGGAGIAKGNNLGYLGTVGGGMVNGYSNAANVQQPSAAYQQMRMQHQQQYAQQQLQQQRYGGYNNGYNQINQQPVVQLSGAEERLQKTIESEKIAFIHANDTCKDISVLKQNNFTGQRLRDATTKCDYAVGVYYQAAHTTNIDVANFMKGGGSPDTVVFRNFRRQEMMTALKNAGHNPERGMSRLAMQEGYPADLVTLDYMSVARFDDTNGTPTVKRTGFGEVQQGYGFGSGG